MDIEIVESEEEKNSVSSDEHQNGMSEMNPRGPRPRFGYHFLLAEREPSRIQQVQEAFP